MQVEDQAITEIPVQKSKDRLKISENGIRFLHVVAIVAFVGCLISLVLNIQVGKFQGSYGSIAGVLISALVTCLLYFKKIRTAIIVVLWAMALIPSTLGFLSFGFNAPGILFFPLAIMAASWALSVRHATAMAVCVCLGSTAFYFLIKSGMIVPIEPQLPLRLIIILMVSVMSLLLGLIGMRALRFEFDRVRELGVSLESKIKDLNLSEVSFSALFLSNPLPSISGDSQGRIIDVNNAFLSDFTYNREQLLNQTLPKIGIFVHAEEMQLITQHSASNGVVGFPVTLRLASGEERHFLMNTATFELSSGRRFVASFLDQTDRLKAEKAQNILNAELEARVVTRTSELSHALQVLQNTQAELVQSKKLASLGSMVAGIAHELNTPVGNALMVSTTLTEQQTQFEIGIEKGLSRTALNQFLDTVRHSSDILYRNLRRTADLIYSFKQIAVDQSGEHRQIFNLHDVVNQASVIMSHNLHNTSFRLIKTIPNDIILDSFPGSLEQVLLNLINNALMHAFEGRTNGEMHLRATLMPNNWVQIYFSDDGIGISETNLQKIFDPFYTTKLGQGGSGLGLSITYNIVTAMLGGRIEARSEIHKGSEFIIEIPLSPNKHNSVNKAVESMISLEH